ncbi:MAG: Crp/Fnr family transcriptional regulator [Gammaproteobacteria bacterium]|nr:Crp/Fnr family transcriptional regulator [Gammaproteobacteria bacterium]
MTDDPDLRTTLRHTYLFTSLTDEELETLLKGARELRLDEGELMFSQGEPAERFFLVRRGQVKLFRLSPEGDEKVIEVIRPGQTFAEAVMFMEGHRYPVNAQALEPTTLIAVDNRVFLALLRRSPETCFRLMADMSMRLHQLVNEINALTLHNATFRLVRYLLNELPPGVRESPMIRLTTPKQVIASRLSIQPETFSRILSRLERRGWIQVEGGNIILCDLDALRALVEE